MKLLELGFKAIENAASNGGGRFGWCATSKARWKRFCVFCEGLSISLVSQIDTETLRKYADVCKSLATSTAQNYISSVNSVLKLLKKNWQSVSPQKLIGRSRSSVRKNHVAFSYHNIQSVIDELHREQQAELAAVVFLAASFGLRRKECVLFDITVSINEAKKKGFVDISHGTKGGRGRYIERPIPCNQYKLEILEELRKDIGDRKSLIPAGMNLKIFYDLISNVCLPVLRKNGIERLHDLRVFYACQRYCQITRCEAPCNQNRDDPVATQKDDEQARSIISSELGHSRMQVVSSYVGRKIRGCDRE